MRKLSTDITKWKFSTRKEMRYETLADWFDSGEIHLYEKLDETEKLAIAIHELVERTLLALKGIGQKEIDALDIVGDGSYNQRMYDSHPMYKKAHRIAENIEKEIIKWSGRDWDKYDRKVMNLDIKFTKINKKRKTN